MVFKKTLVMTKLITVFNIISVFNEIGDADLKLLDVIVSKQLSEWSERCFVFCLSYVVV